MTRKQFFHDALLFIVPCCGLAMGGFMLYCIIHFISIDPVKWSNFFNGTLPDMITRAIFPIFTVYFLNWSHAGFPVSGILAIDGNSTVWQKMVAMLFLVGMAYVVSYAVKIG